MECPLCQNNSITPFYKDQKRAYFQCKFCDLVFVHQDNLPHSKAEKLRYDKHENDPNDKGYTSFLQRIIDPLKAQLNPNDYGLDFGCGPTPILAQTLANEGFTMKSYDPFYQENQEYLNQQYDFITATEVVEHLHAAHIEFDLFNKLLKNNGTLAIMTQLRTPNNYFKNWYYKDDFTHVCFYSLKTMYWVANHYDYKIKVFPPDIIIFTKKR